MDAILDFIIRSRILETDPVVVSLCLGMLFYIFTKNIIQGTYALFGRFLKHQMTQDREEKNIERVQNIIKAIRTASIEAISHEIQILIAMGDLAVEPLIVALQDENPRVRWVAAKALGEINDSRMIKPLINATYDRDSSVRLMATTILANVDDVEVVEPLTVRLRDNDRYVRLAAFQPFIQGRIDFFKAGDALIAFLKDEESNVRKEAARILARTKDARAVDSLIKLLSDFDWTVQEQAVYALQEIGDLRAVVPLIKMLEHETLYLRGVAARALAKFGDPLAVEPLIEAIADEENFEIKEILVRSLKELTRAKED